MNDTPTSLVNLLTYLFEYRTCCLVADDGLVSMVWCKRGFKQWRSNFDGKFLHCKGYGAKKLSKEFPNKGWGLWGLNKLLTKQLQETGTIATRSSSFESIQNLSCFLLCNIYTKPGHYKKGIRH